MKEFCFIIVLLGIGLAQSLTTRLPKHNIRPLLEECRRSENATEVDIEAIKEHIVPDTRVGKCLIACAYRLRMNFQTGDGVSLEEFKKFTNFRFGHNGVSSKVTDEIAANCARNTHPDRCELAAMLFKCEFDEVRRLGIDEHL